MGPRGAALASGESRRTSSQLWIGGDIIMPRDISRVQNPQRLYRLEAGSHRRVGGQRRCSGVAQIAVVAGVGWREWAVAWCLLGRCGSFAVADDRERVEGRSCGERGNGSPQHGM